MKTVSPRNRTLGCDATELAELGKQVMSLTSPTTLTDITDKIIHQDIFTAAPLLPTAFADLLIIDPPYNLTKNYNGRAFFEKSTSAYADWFGRVLHSLRHTLKPHASIYTCADWRTSMIIAPLLEKYFQVKNRITWEREKGRGAKFNWKNNLEDIWFCTRSNDYYFNVEAVKLKRRVLAPYRQDGQAKDWYTDTDGKYRLTHPSNIWTDISIPFWSMPENTAHPTQKPEKLIAKLILASSQVGDVVFDPFMGSGTTAVTAKKLERRFVCVEHNKEYCCWGLKRLHQSLHAASVQGYVDGVFWERNSFGGQSKKSRQQKNDVAQSAPRGLL